MIRWFRGARGDKRLHLILTWAWIVESVAVMWWLFATGADAVFVYLVGISQYAIVVGHWSSYQAAKPSEDEE